MRQIHLCLERIVVRIFGGEIAGAGQGVQVCGSYRRQSSRVERGNHARVWGISRDIGWAGGSRVEDIRIDLSRTRAGSRNRRGARRIEVIGVRVCNLLLVVVQAETAPQNQLPVVEVWTPVEADLWSKVKVLRVPGVDSRAYGDSGQEIGTGAEPQHAHVVVLVGKGSEV